MNTSTIKKPFAVIGTVLKTARASDINGPFAKTHEEAVEAFKAMLIKKGLEGKTLYNLAVVEKAADKMKASCSTSKFGYELRVTGADAEKVLLDRGFEKSHGGRIVLPKAEA